MSAIPKQLIFFVFRPEFSTTITIGILLCSFAINMEEATPSRRMELQELGRNLLARKKTVQQLEKLFLMYFVITPNVCCFFLINSVLM